MSHNNNTMLAAQIENALINAVTTVLGIAANRVDPQEDLSSYGFDSITLTQLANQLNQQFDFVRLEAATFLEHTSIAALQTHLQHCYAAEFAAVWETATESVTEPAPPHAAPTAPLAASKAPAGNNGSGRLQPVSAPETAPLSSVATIPAALQTAPASDKPTTHITGSALLDAFELPPMVEAATSSTPATYAAQMQAEQTGLQDIAIIGIAGQFPGATNVIALWENLVQEKNTLTEVPQERWDWQAIYGDPNADANVTDCCYGGFLAQLDHFDPLFFGISPLEAEQMDPQQKLVLQATWETLDNAGYAMSQLKGEAVGVYLGVQRNENLLNLMKDGKNFGPYTNIGNTHSMLANRVSYFFDWRGNSLSVDTACSASASALHLAYHALRRDEIKLALVGGVTMVQDPFSHIANRKMGLLTNQQKVCSFDASAGGYLIGEGVATALLKPLAQAQQDGDYIYGVIKSCEVNQSGKTLFLTAPDPKAHVKVIRSALQKAQLTPGDIDYLEGQGTGTALSDKAELKAYAEVFREATPSARPLPAHKLGLGSIKGNIGHVESAAGITSLLKVCLAMKNALIPPVLNFSQLNWNETDPASLPFNVVAQKQPWPARHDAQGHRLPRRAGVHNFGYGGLSAHFIIEEYRNPCQQVDRVLPPPRPELLLFSAKTPAQLTATVQQFVRYLVGAHYHYFGIATLYLGDIAHTLQTGRQAFPVRLAVIANSVEALTVQLQRYLSGETEIPGVVSGSLSAELQVNKTELSAAWYQQEAWDELAHQWVTGATFSGQIQAQLTSGQLTRRGQRIPLPHYCFAPPHAENAMQVSQPLLNPVAWQRYAEAFAQLEQLTQQLLLTRFQEWGVCLQTGEVLETVALQNRIGIAAQHHRLFALLLEILAKAGYVQAVAEHRYQVLNPLAPSPTELAQQRDQLLRNFPELTPQISLTWECLAHLTPILSGQLPATQILFPDASMQRVEGFYKGNPVVDYFNALVRWQVVAAIQALRPHLTAGKTVRLLEIGAGTGGVTAGLLKAIAGFGDQIEYVYSDISAGFTQFGKHTYGPDYPFLQFQVLDIEQDPVKQGVAPQSFDIIIASNVLHATRTMQHTLRNTQRLLTPHGRLILNEVTHAQDFISLTFGLLQGWWAFEDVAQRLPGGPLLNGTLWRELLTGLGFQSVVIYGDNTPDGTDTGYNVIVAAPTAALQATQTELSAANLSAVAPLPPRAVTQTVAPADHALMQQVRAIFAEVLKVEPSQLEFTAPYVEFGVDSFTSLQVVNALKDRLAVELRSTDLFNFPSIQQLSASIQQQRAQSAAPLATQAVAPPTQATEDLKPATANAQPPTRSSGQQAEIAIIGFSGRFPQADDVNIFWQHLREGRDCVTDIPPERQWPASDFRGGFIADIDRFDPLFFNLSPREAQWMEPQQRLFLQEAWRVFEQAGYASEGLRGSRCGVFVGCREGDYLKAFPGLAPHSHQGTGNSSAMLAARIAYFLDLKGPSIAIDTACSSSLVALHLACDSLNNGTCDMALAGGVSLLCTDESHQVLSKSGMLSPEGQCKTFDESANGFVPGEAVGVVLLKPLAQAQRDGDHIFGLICGHGINQDGKTNGITAASATSQTALEQEVYQRYQIHPDTINYVEAHGTGTRLGDPIEVDALTDSFRAYTQQQQFCALGSVKTNIGHTLAAAGITGLIKLLLALQHKQLPPSLHFKQENQHLHLAHSPFYVNTTLQDWTTTDGQPRRAALSAFGFSGTNAHCVIEEAPPQTVASAPEQSLYLIPLSAQTAADLVAKIQALNDWLTHTGTAYALADIAATLLLGRTHFAYRVALLVSDQQDLSEQLQQLASRPLTDWQRIVPPEQHSAALKAFGQTVLTQLQQGQISAEALPDTWACVQDLYQQGYELAWAQLYQTAAQARPRYRTVPLPTYPFVGARYWLAQTADQSTATATAIKQPAAAPSNATQALFKPLPFPPQTAALSAFQAAYAELTTLCAELLASVLQDMGAFTVPGQAHTLAELQTQLGIIPKYHRLLSALLKILLDAQYLRQEGTQFVRIAELEQPSLAAQAVRKDQFIAEYPQLQTFTHLLWVCVQEYPAVLQGQRSATDVMFPGGSFELVKGIYKENATADFYNQMLVNNLVAHVQAILPTLAHGQTLQILEIGAGTGGTSALLLERLQPFGDRLSYLYSDISSGFAQYGRRTYGPRYPFAQFEVLDIEKPIPADCRYRQTFDIVVAANVIHATRTLAHTLDHVKALLKPQGYLFLNEATDVQDFATMTYGLLEGWWLFEDSLRLENSPLLDAAMWSTLFAEKGFTLAPPQGLSGERKGPGQHILIAQHTAAPMAATVAVAEKAEPAAAASQTMPATSPPPAAGVSLEKRLIDTVKATIFHILGLTDEALVMQQPFSEYGLDSISGIDLLDLLKQTLGIQLPVTVLFDYPDVQALAAHLYQEYRDHLSADYLAQAESSAETTAPAPVTSAIQPATPPATATTVNAATTNPATTTSAAPATASAVEHDIAIIGYAGRFSGSANAAEFWENLAAGVCSISEPPPNRWPANSVPPGYQAGFLHDIDQFDATFFNWSGSEAEEADPQQRIFLEEAYSALENAGYAPTQARQLNCGVFAGAGMSDYLMNMREQGYGGAPQTFWGNSPAVVPARIAYFLNLQGPTIAIDTACSSSLVALHYARQSILAGECEMALAGGVYLCTTPHFHTLASKAQMLAPDGKCKAFDQNANGFVFGEGAGVLVLKRLSAAQRDHDHIVGVIKGSAVNQDGKTNGISAPSRLSQIALAQRVYQTAQLDPATISYVEAHGTGTKLGDPVEVNALTDAFAQFTDRKQFCALGSVKTNIGHASLAAGVASVIKVLQSFAHQQIPASLHFSQPNAHIDFANSPFYVNSQLQPWPRTPAQPRRAAVSGFGLSGTNAHLVLEEPPAVSVTLADTQPMLICLTAKTATALQQKCRDLAAYLSQPANAYPLAHIAYTLHLGREHFAHRFAVVAENRADLIQQLQRADSWNAPPVEADEAAAAQVLAQVSAATTAAERSELLQHLAAQYCQGVTLDWRLLYSAEEAYRVPLPSYPYERSRFWFPLAHATSQAVVTEVTAPAATPVEPTRAATPPASAALDHTWWQPQWEVAPVRTVFGDDERNQGPLLIFAKADHAVDFWQTRGIAVTLVVASTEFAVTMQADTLVVQIRPGLAEDYQQLVEVLTQYNRIPVQVLHCWSQHNQLSLDATAALFTAQINTHLAQNFYALLFFSQALQQRQVCPKKLHYIYAFMPTSGRDYALNQAFAGLAKTLNQENPAFFCQTLHLPELTQVNTLAAQEFQSATPQAVEVRYHGHNGNAVREVKVWRRAAPQVVNAPALALKHNGTYLLLGGVGGLGLIFARYLQQQAEQQQCPIRLCLTGRQPLSPTRQQALTPLTSRYCAVDYVAGDITQLADTQAIVAQAKQSQGGIAGIFHFAGTTRDGLLLNKTADQCQAVLAPKIHGLLNLEYALTGEKLDFLSLFSSGSAVLGNIGQGDYAYANAFLDAFATQGGIGNSHCFSINWALWKAGGMTLPAAKLAAMNATMGVHGLDNAHGLQAWETCLHAQWPQAMFLPGVAETITPFVNQHFIKPSKRNPQATTLTPPPTSSVQTMDIQKIYQQAERIGHATAQATPASSTVTPIAAAASTPKSNASKAEIECFLTQAIAEVSRLPLAKIGTTQPFESFGLDSLMITSLNDKLMNEFGALPATLFFEYQTVSALADFLARNSDGSTNTMPQTTQQADVMSPRLTTTVPSSRVAKAEIESFLTQAIAEVSRLPLAKIGTTQPFESFGLDSLMITSLNDKLMNAFGALPATLFFEYQTVSALADFLARNSDNKMQQNTAAQPAATAARQQASSASDILRRADNIGQATAAHRAPAMPAPKPATSRVNDIYRRAENVGQASNGDSTAGPQISSNATSSNNSQAIETFLVHNVLEVSRLPAKEVSVTRPLEAFSLDSLMITALNDKLTAKFGPLPATLFFEYPTLRALAQFLASRPAAAISNIPPPTRTASDIARQAEGLGHPKSVTGATTTEVVAPAAGTHSPLVTAQPNQTENEAIAIIGMSGIFPEAENLNQFWDNLQQGRDCIRSEIPRERWNIDDYYDPDRNLAMHGKIYCRAGGFVDDYANFDAAFFGISPREAKVMDPSERVFLQQAWAALEDAGYHRTRLADSCDLNVGVFAGLSNYAYALWGPQAWEQGNWFTPCGGLWTIANRVSFVMNLNGPSFPVDTACSSSLSAVHQACLSLKNGECKMALAGGASFNVHPQQYIGMCQNQMLSPSGHCHSFGADGDGFVPGEGAGVVVLKPLAQAVADGDHIYGVIKSTAVNHGGRTNGYAVPNPKAHAELIKQALTKVQLDPRSISYVEAHGTGTALGDPVEFEGLRQAWNSVLGTDNPTEKQWCALGSVKSNIGHLNAAAGISGLLKLLLQLQHQQLVPSLHAVKPNPKIDFANSPFYLQQHATPWPSKPQQPRRAAISSFGVGGMNAHVIVEEYQAPTRTQPWPSNETYLIPFSARNRARLTAYVEQFLAFWEPRQTEIALADLAYSLQTGREPMSERVVFLAQQSMELTAQLRAFLRDEASTGYVSGQAGAEAFVLPNAHTLTPQALAQQWVQGAEIAWQHLPCWARYQPQRVPLLPTYPFAKKRHWYPDSDETTTHTMPATSTLPTTPATPEPVEVLAAYQAGFADLTTLASAALLRTVQQLGGLRCAGECYTQAQLKQHLGVSAEHDRLFPALLDILQQAGYLEIDGDTVCSTALVEQPPAVHSLDYWCAKQPALAANFQLLWECLAHLGDILQGKRAATDIIFPNSSMERVENVYKNNPIADYYNQFVIDAVVAFVREQVPNLAAGQKLHLLEIGAGTGGTSAPLFKALQPYQAHLHYDYTDVSLKFIQYGKQHYSHYDFVEFNVLDVEQSVQHQGYDLHRVDLLIATNVLHATRRLENTLHQVKSLLRREGRLLINEAVETHPFSTLTFGLLKGWWLSEDFEQRLPGSPLLSVTQWQQCLHDLGFYAVQTLAPVVTTGVSQNVFMACSDGQLRADLTPPAINKPRVTAAAPIVIAQAKSAHDSETILHRVSDQVRRIVATVIEVEAEEVNPDSTYLDMGIDSILAIEIINQLNQTLAIQLRTTAVFDYATVSQLAEHIVSRFGDEMVVSQADDPSAEEDAAEADLLAVLQRLHGGELSVQEANRLLGQVN